ncbi:MAG: hypothetical protein ACLGG3_06785, partial [Alphaproteobacteria bacterium]
MSYGAFAARRGQISGPYMRLRLVSAAALLAAIAPASTAWALELPAGEPPAAVAAAAPAQDLQPASVAELVERVDIPWSRFTLDNGLTVIVH